MIEGRVHFIGIGGAGMSAVAYLMARRGVAVSGSDAVDGPYVRALRQAGVDARVGHDAANVVGADIVVVTSAVRDANPELIAARAAGLPVWHRSVALAEAVRGMRVIAVAGAHGKTTTSAMVAHALRGAGIDATFAIGATVAGVEGAVGGAYAGSSDVAVIEADESDGSFLVYDAEVAVITNVEPDHLDHYSTAEAVAEAFATFAAKAPTVIACLDDAGASRAAEAARTAGTRVITYGVNAGADVILDREFLAMAGQRLPLRVPQPGWHNRLNAAAAVAAAAQVGADPARAAAALADYAGTGRRFELRGVAAGVEVVDDYAHHPTEITSAIAAAREHTDGRLVVLFQPHLYSRTRLLARDFGVALSLADADVVLTGIYGAREEPEPGVSSASIGAHVVTPASGTFRITEDLREAALEAARLARPGGLVLTVGAGSVTDAATWILETLAGRE